MRLQIIRALSPSWQHKQRFARNAFPQVTGITLRLSAWVCLGPAGCHSSPLPSHVPLAAFLEHFFLSVVVVVVF